MIGPPRSERPPVRGALARRPSDPHRPQATSSLSGPPPAPHSRRPPQPRQDASSPHPISPPTSDRYVNPQSPTSSALPRLPRKRAPFQIPPKPYPAWSIGPPRGHRQRRAPTHRRSPTRGSASPPPLMGRRPLRRGRPRARLPRPRPATLTRRTLWPRRRGRRASGAER